MHPNFKFLLASFIFFNGVFSQYCFDKKVGNTSCWSCSYNSSKNTFDWSYDIFDSSLCTLKNFTQVPTLEFFVNSSIPDCISGFCDGSIQNPFNDLFSALEKVMIAHFNYFNTTAIVYLFGSNSHYLFPIQSIKSPFYLFRRFHIDLTIQAFLCKFKNVSGCFEDDSTNVDILIKRSDILFFVSNKIMLRNLIFNGIDLLLYGTLSNDQFKLDNIRKTVCSENDINFNNTNDSVLSLCFLRNQNVSISNLSTYGFFNLERIYDCDNCSFPEFSMINCQIINFMAFNSVSNPINSLVNNIRGFANKITINNTIISNIFFTKGIINSAQLEDSFYKSFTLNYVCLMITYVAAQKTYATITLNNIMFDGFNSYNNTLKSGITVDYMALLNLQMNATSNCFWSNCLPVLKLSIFNSTFSRINNEINNFNTSFYMFLISGYNNTLDESECDFINNTIFNFNNGALFYVYNRYISLTLDNCKFLNITKVYSYFLLTNVTFSNNIIDSLYIGSHSFIETNQANINISHCSFSHLFAIYINSFLINNANIDGNYLGVISFINSSFLISTSSFINAIVKTNQLQLSGCLLHFR